MTSAQKHCTSCGQRWQHPDDAWPRTCPWCKETSWQNPLPVTVILAPCGEGLLGVRRSIEPMSGHMALPGGYMEVGESWQEGAARELFEETGAKVSPADITLFDVVSPLTSRTLLIFCLAPDVTGFDFVPNNEVSEVSIIHEGMTLAFPTHFDMVRKWFRDYGHIAKAG